jgi:hypothetical protein
MADYGFDGMIKVSFVPAASITNIAAPTVSQLNGGTSLEGRLTPDGLSLGIDTSEIDNSKLNSLANSAIIGRDTYSPSVKYVRGDGTNDVAVQTALVRGASGFLAVRRDKLATIAWTAADKVELYPVQCKRPSPDDPAPNALQTVMVGMTMTDGTQVRGIDNPATVAA